MPGPTLMLLPGTLCDETLFASQVEQLSNIADCIVSDVAGCSRLADTARHVLSDAPERFALAGLSFGGIVAFEIMRQAPERVTRLALLNTTPKPPTPETRDRLAGFVSMAQRGEFSKITTDYLKDTMLHPDNRPNLALRRKVLAMAERIGVKGYINQIIAQLERPDSTPDLAGIGVPTLVLTGREDKVCTVALHREMAAKIADSRLIILEHCGHLSTLEQPEQVGAAMRDWLLNEGIWQRVYSTKHRPMRAIID